MEDLSLHVLDIAQNSLAAGAKHLRIDLLDLAERDELVLTVEDDGCGMSKDFLERVTDPFVTTRTTRSVGMGIPLLKMSAEMTGGSFSIESAPGVGTTVRAIFHHSHIDRPPIGNMAETITVILQGHPNISLHYQRTTVRDTFDFDSEEIARELKDIPLNAPEILQWIREYIAENERGLYITESKA